MGIYLQKHLRVTGQLDEHFRDLEDLEGLMLGRTQVSGDIGVLFHNKKMKKLDLSKTGVTGNIEALKDATNLKQLVLSNTAIAGDLAPLKDTKLKKIDVSNTNVGCSQDAPLGTVLLKLGLKEVEGVERQTLSCRVMRLVFSFVISFVSRDSNNGHFGRKIWKTRMKMTTLDIKARPLNVFFARGRCFVEICCACFAYH